jgi:hypothetical protein
MVELVRATRTAKLTNIGRFFSSDVMDRLHLSIKVNEENTIQPRTLHAHHDAVQLRSFFSWAFNYILNKSVDFYKNEGARRKAIGDALEKTPDLIPRMSDASDHPHRLADTALYYLSRTDTNADPAAPGQPDPNAANPAIAPTASAEATGESRKPVPDPNTEKELPTSTSNGTTHPGSGRGESEARPERVLLQGLKLPNHPQRVRRLLKECQSLEIEGFPGIACIMLRVLVELSVSTEAALALSGADEADPLGDKINKMLHYLDPNIDRQRKRDDRLAHAYFEVISMLLFITLW